MSRLNPIYLLALVFTLFVISIILFKNKKEEFKSLNSEYSSFQTKVKDFNDYKQKWFDREEITKRIDTILKSPTFKREKLLRTENSGVIKIKIESNNPRVLSRFLNRFLNERFIIKRLDVQKSSVSLDIGLK